MSKESVKQRIKAVFKPNGVGSINGANSQSALTDAIGLMYDDLQIQISYLHESVMYKTRNGAGTVLDPYVYSDPLTPASNTLYIDIDNALAPKAYYFSDDVYHAIKADGYVNWGDINGILSAQTDLVAALATKASATDFSSHIANTNNPHSVTKSQVGLGNVDNTSDADKPISTSAASALFGKVDKVAGKELSDNNFSDEYKTAVDGSVRFDESQELTSRQKQTARDNIDAPAISGNYPEMQVGSAANIQGRNQVGANIVLRPTADNPDIGNGNALIKQIAGYSIGWNQHIGQVLSTYGVTASFDSDGILTINGTSTNQIAVKLINNAHAPLGHKWYLSVKRISGSVTAVDTTPQVLDGWQMLTGPDVLSGGEALFSSYSSMDVRLFGSVGDVYNNLKLQIQLIDLSLLFRSGEMPANLENFKTTKIGRLVRFCYHAYNAGTILNNCNTGIKTVGFNLLNTATKKAMVIADMQYQITGWYSDITLNGKTITPDANGFFTTTEYGELSVAQSDNTTCLHFVHSGSRNGDKESHWESTASLPITTATGKLNGQGASVVVFPQGMKSAGWTYDETWNEEHDGVLVGYAIKRINTVNLGTLSWQYHAVDETYPYGYFYATIADKHSGDEMTCSYYAVGANLATDISIKGSESDGMVYVVDSRYTDVATFTSAMAGVSLNYWTNTNARYVMDSPWADSYRVDDYGTEQQLPLPGSIPTSSPLLLYVEYNLNARDAIRNLYSNFVATSAQILTELQKVSARGNIGAADASELAECVKTVAQTLTAAQKAQVKNNLGIADAMRVKIADSALTPDTNGYVTLPIAGIWQRADRYAHLGLVQVGSAGEGTGSISITADGEIRCTPLGELHMVNRYTNPSGVLMGSNYDLAVKHAMCDEIDSTVRNPAWIDTEKNGAWARLTIIKTALDAVLIPNAKYFLGSQSSVALTFPASASAGQTVEVHFTSGATATTLTINGSVAGDSYTPSANKLCELNFEYDGTYWKMCNKEYNIPE